MSTDDRLDDLLRETLRAREAGSDCPPETVWLDLVEQRLQGDEAESLRAHLADCAACAAIARDARRFATAFEGTERSSTSRSWLLSAVVAAAVLVVTVVALVLALGRTGTPRPGAVERLAAELDVPAPARSGTAPDEQDLAYRGPAADERSHSLDNALAPYRERRFEEACKALSAHGRRFPADRTGRYFGGVACLEAGALDRADELLAGLAASPGERRDDARQLLDRLRRARNEDAR